jgi:uncharacterized surface protein with fasciclin (FAS1) repeats
MSTKKSCFPESVDPLAKSSNPHIFAACRYAVSQLMGHRALCTMTLLLLLLLLTIQAAVCVKLNDSTSAMRGNVVLQHSEKIPTEVVERFDEADDLMELGLLNYMETVKAVGEDTGLYSKFLELMTAAGETDTLNNANGITILAPSDGAISPNMKDFLLAAENFQILQVVMNYHMIPSVVSFLSPQFQQTTNGIATTTLLTVAGDMLQLSLDQNGFYINGIIKALAYALANESILYRIDRLLIPPSTNGLIPEELLVENSQVKESVLADISYEFPILIPDDFFTFNVNTSPGPVTDAPSMIPVDFPSTAPSSVPKSVFSDAPSIFLQDSPAPFAIGSDAPSLTPSDAPSLSPSDAPSFIPSDVPSFVSSEVPSSIPSNAP